MVKSTVLIIVVFVILSFPVKAPSTAKVDYTRQCLMVEEWRSTERMTRNLED